MEIKTKARKWGNSIAIILPKIVVENDNIKENDEVIVPTLTFVASAHVVTWLKAKPVLVDSEEGTFNIDVKKIEEKITSNTKAIMPVHYGGHSCDMDEINKIAEKYNLRVIEDAAHAVGSE